MELREPPLRTAEPRVDRLSRGLLLVILLVLMALGAMLISRSRHADGREDAEHIREVAARLQAAGALDEAALQYQRYLEAGDPSREARVGIAVSLGNNYLDSGHYERALRWFYEAETLGAGDLGEELAGKVVHTLERLGRPYAAQSALASRARLPEEDVERPEDDPVVARIGSDEILRSDVERALDDLPPELAAQVASAEGRARYLEQYVADELLWRKAMKLEYDKDPEVLRQHQALFKQLVVSRFAEREVLNRIEVDEADLRNHFDANRNRFVPVASEGEQAVEPSFEEVRAIVERDYRRMKMQSAYQAMIDSEMAAQGVELDPEKMSREP